MKAIVVMFDSLNRHMLPPYGCTWTHAPNFSRLAQRSATFDRSYICSMPCMPARRDMHTGRPNFLHSGWGPLQPFDDSAPEILKTSGVSSHLISDHFHYWEDGGATYHNRYSTWQFERGQEGDFWMGQVADPQTPPAVCPRSDNMWRQDWINRQFMPTEEKQPQARTFSAAEDFIRRNHAQDRWFLQIETFDPHEPFFSHQKYKDLYPHDYQGKHFDWPPYRGIQETREEVEHCRYEYAALLSMCDHYMGKVLDLMDELDLWKDTLLIVCTDHGFLLGEHDCWAKVWMPYFQEIANTPFFVWDPRSRVQNQRRQSLVQPSIDVGPTLLEFFDLPLTSDMLGKPLGQTVANDTPVREAAIFGNFGGQVSVTDGHHVYMRSPVTQDNSPLFNYTLMPAHMKSRFTVDELRDNIELAEPFTFTKGVRTMKIRARAGRTQQTRFPTALYNVQADPQQQAPIQDDAIEEQLVAHMVRLMHECDAPSEQYERLGLAPVSAGGDQKSRHTHRS